MGVGDGLGSGVVNMNLFNQFQQRRPMPRHAFESLFVQLLDTDDGGVRVRHKFRVSSFKFELKSSANDERRSVQGLKKPIQHAMYFRGTFNQAGSACFIQKS